MLAQVQPTLIILTLTLISGFCDSLGFTHASRMWQGSTLIVHEALHSAAGFALGISIYWIAVRHLNQAGIVAVEIQTLLWFGTTLIGVAALSGRFLQWRSIDQAVGIAVLVGIGWLLLRTEG
jgi:hypothetical protein